VFLLHVCRTCDKLSTFVLSHSNILKDYRAMCYYCTATRFVSGHIRQMCLKGCMLACLTLLLL
jgi:hypothetical protein